jgi:hypothetical protein
VVATLPLFPLGTVLLPGASLPLHIFEPRYRQMTLDLVTEAVPGRSFGVVATRPGYENGTVIAGAIGTPNVHEIGCSAVLNEVRRLPDGRFDLVTTGDRRFKVLEIDESSAPYLVATVDWLPDGDLEEQENRILPMLARAARDAHRHYCATAWRQEDWEEPDAAAEPATLSHLLATDCLLALEDRQDLLEEVSSAKRLRLIRSLLTREAEILRTLRAVPVPLTQFATESSRN